MTRINDLVELVERIETVSFELRRVSTELEGLTAMAESLAEEARRDERE